MSEQNSKIGTDTINVHESVIQKAVKEARLRAGIAKPAGPHTLRHSFEKMRK